MMVLVYGLTAKKRERSVRLSVWLCWQAECTCRGGENPEEEEQCHKSSLY